MGTLCKKLSHLFIPRHKNVKDHMTGNYCGQLTPACAAMASSSVPEGKPLTARLANITRKLQTRNRSQLFHCTSKVKPPAGRLAILTWIITCTLNIKEYSHVYILWTGLDLRLSEKYPCLYTKGQAHWSLPRIVGKPFWVRALMFGMCLSDHSALGKNGHKRFFFFENGRSLFLMHLVPSSHTGGERRTWATR